MVYESNSGGGGGGGVSQICLCPTPTFPNVFWLFASEAVLTLQFFFPRSLKDINRTGNMFSWVHSSLLFLADEWLKQMHNCL